MFYFERAEYSQSFSRRRTDADDSCKAMHRKKAVQQAKIASGKSEKTLKKAKSGALQFSGIGEMLTVFWKLNHGSRNR